MLRNDGLDGKPSPWVLLFRIFMFLLGLGILTLCYQLAGEKDWGMGLWVLGGLGLTLILACFMDFQAAQGDGHGPKQH